MVSTVDPMPPELDLVPGPPELEDYRRLRVESGLSAVTVEQARGALRGSWAFCHVRSDEAGTVAMGRVLGDGGWYFHVADMATSPEHQGRGLGRRVLTWLLAQVEEHAPADPYVTLMGDEPGRRLYRSLGFVDTAPQSIGMRLAVRR